MSLFGFIVDLLKPVKPGEYFRMLEEKEKETPEKMRARIRNSEWYCKIHDNYFWGTSQECYYCRQAVEEEKRLGLFPPGIDKKNCNYYYSGHYERYHLIENKRKAGEISDAEARRQWREIVDSEINAKVKKDEELAQRKKDDEKRLEAQKRRDYEEAEKIYGIWTPH